MRDVIIIGGGAAGLFLGGLLCHAGTDVLIIEKNPRPGLKLSITGKGRCNLTNNCTPEELLPNVRTNPKFLLSAVNCFTPQDTMRHFEALSVPLKTERGRRVFPVSDRAADVVSALLRYIKDGGGELRTGTVKSARYTDDTYHVTLADGTFISSRRLVLATGGLSYPRTGSTGDGYTLAADFGHSIVPPAPSLVPIETKEAFCAELTGLTLKNITLSLFSGDKLIYEELGELLFTHFGISGPLTLSASAHMRGVAGYRIALDLKPGLTREQLDRRILRDFDMSKNKELVNALVKLLPHRLIPAVLMQAEIPAATKVHSVTKEQREALIDALKGLWLTPSALRPISEAVITAGGVKVSEVNPKTMESRLCPGLYIVGELLDLDAYTGGYNLQIAFSTAYAAYKHISSL